MVVTFLFELARAVLDFLGGLLPAWDPVDLSGAAATITSAGAPAFALLRWMNYYLPVNQVITAAGLLMTMWTAAHVIGMVEWILTKLRIIGGGGK